MRLEASMEVTKVVATVADDDYVTITLKGKKNFTIEGPDMGYDLDDTAEVSMTVKLHSPTAAKYLGLEYGSTQMLTLKDRDTRLDSFESAMESEIPGSSPSLDAYRGTVPDEVLDKLESAIPEHILKEIA